MDQLSENIEEMELKDEEVTSASASEVRSYDKPFRGLPAELRTIIWRHVLRTEISVNVPALCREESGCIGPWPTNPYALLQVNKQVRSEAKAELSLSFVFEYAKPGPRERWNSYGPNSQIWHKHNPSQALQTGVSTNTMIPTSSSSPTIKIAYPSMIPLQRKPALAQLHLILQIIPRWGRIGTESVHMHVNSHGKGLCKRDLQLLIAHVHVHLDCFECHEGQRPDHMRNRMIASWDCWGNLASLRAASLSYTIWHIIRRPEGAGPLNLTEVERDRRKWFEFSSYPLGKVSETWVQVDDDHYECRVTLPHREALSEQKARSANNFM